jgi:hypothetical protein
LKSIIRAAIENMLREDAATHPARRLLDTAERNITARLREHLVPLLKDTEWASYQVDHEYHRVGADGNVPKFSTILNQNVVPDIAVHMRGVRRKDRPDANLLVIEVKQIRTFTGTVQSISDKKQREGLTDDLKKLEALRSLDDEFGYVHAASLVFSDRGSWISLDGDAFDLFLPAQS